MFPVSPEKEKLLMAKLDSLGIHERDLQEAFVRSQGKGGQNVNKVSTCVYLKHIPTGEEVKCQKSRSQGLNRYYARVLLFEKIERLIKGRESEEKQRIEKIRRQKRKRSKRAKEKILAEKRLHSIKKAGRSIMHIHEGDM
ncbi:MAG: peptide chain release factor-like protein [Nitrospirae bacterium]|nr:peptide chain release factor-like protein [Nitrospirota bacterium]